MRIRFWGAVIISLLAVYGEWHVLRTIHLLPANDGALDSLYDQLAVGGLAAAIALAFAAGVYVYLPLYIKGIERRGGSLEITTQTPRGDLLLDIPLSDLSLRYHHHERLTEHQIGGGIKVTLGAVAPTVPIWVTGNRLPLVLDLRSKEIDAKSLAEIIGRQPEEQ